MEHEHGHGHGHGHEHGHEHGGSAQQAADEAGWQGGQAFDSVAWRNGVLATALISSASLVTLPFLSLLSRPSVLKIGMAFAVGGLLGDVFLHIVPHEMGSDHDHGGHDHGGHDHGGHDDTEHGARPVAAPSSHCCSAKRVRR